MEHRKLPPPERGAVLRLSRIAARPAEQQAGAARLQAVGALAGGIAHDFNNLLTAIAGSAEAALSRAPGGEAASELRQVLESAGRGAALVRQLLAFARQQALRPRVVDLNIAVSAMGELLRRLLGSRVRLTIALEEPARRVRMDPTQLDQVIMNLALNARDAMPEGGSLRIATGHAVVLSPETIGTETLPAGRYAMLEVVDSGAGIPPEVLPDLRPLLHHQAEQGHRARPFHRARHHPAIRSSSRWTAAGGGDALPHLCPERRAGGPGWRGHGGPPLRGPAPSPPIRIRPRGPACCWWRMSCAAAPAERALRAGFEVMSAGCSEEALEMLEKTEVMPLALVSDVVMPGLDGLELTARLRDRWPELPVLLVSGYAEAALGRDLAAERIRLLAKPYSLGALVTELKGILPEGVVKVS